MFDFLPCAWSVDFPYQSKTHPSHRFSKQIFNTANMQFIVFWCDFRTKFKKHVFIAPQQRLICWLCSSILLWFQMQIYRSLDPEAYHKRNWRISKIKELASCDLTLHGVRVRIVFIFIFFQFYIFFDVSRNSLNMPAVSSENEFFSMARFKAARHEYTS